MSSLELYREKERSSEAVREMSDIVGRIVSLLRFEATDVYEICRKAFEGAQILDYGKFTAIESGDFPKQWKNACADLRADDESKRLFEQVGRILGSYDLESQLERLSHIQSELSERAKLLRDKAESTRKLYTTLGAMLGLGISIVII